MTAKSTMIFLAIAATLMLTACKPATPSVLDNVSHTPGELIYNPDMFLGNFSSLNTTVLGVSVGMTEKEVTNKLGAADHVDEFDFGAIRNLYYGQSIGINGTAVIYHIEHGFVTRIVVGPDMNPLLGYTTAVNKSKADIYTLFGTPSRQYDVKQGRFFVYNKQGYEVYLNNKGVEYQYAFVYPNRKLDTTAYYNKTKNQYEILKPEIPRLISDTTTLCDQGKTFGYSKARDECEQFISSCEIPDTWIEVDSCPNATAGAQ
jgi:outer membrane protein assembly factor BamE (lipoprotein component of BamABCDE complex)